MLCADLARVHWQDSEGNSHQTVGNLEDISVKGMCLQLDLPLDRDIPVVVEIGPIELHGMVRCCYYREIGYFLGVEFQAEEWTPDKYTPQHLLDLEKLIKKNSAAC